MHIKVVIIKNSDGTYYINTPTTDHTTDHYDYVLAILSKVLNPAANKPADEEKLIEGYIQSAEDDLATVHEWDNPKEPPAENSYQCLCCLHQFTKQDHKRMLIIKFDEKNQAKLEAQLQVCPKCHSKHIHNKKTKPKPEETTPP